MAFTSLFHKGPPPTLQILYQGTVVAVLQKTSVLQTMYSFEYLPAFKEKKLAPLPGLPFSEKPVQSKELWPYFAERIPDARRPEIRAWMIAKKLKAEDDIRLLAELGSHSITDPFEIKRVA